MRRIAGLLAAAALVLWGNCAPAQEVVHFPSLEDNGAGQPATMLDGYIFRPAGAGRHPAIIGVHGCSGMLGKRGEITSLYREWAAEFNRRGYVVLEVDSLGPRQHDEMCSIGGFDAGIYRKRPRDAYGALLYLQSQPFVRADRIALVGWSQGGAVTLFAIDTHSLSRPATLPQGDFRAAVTFYPGACDVRRHPPDWINAVPLLVLLGAEDVWTPMAPCKTLSTARPRGVPVSKCRSIPAPSRLRCAEPGDPNAAELRDPPRRGADRRHRPGSAGRRAPARAGVSGALSR